MKRGELVPVKIVLELITEDMVAHLEKSEGFLIDGYPRNVNQVSPYVISGDGAGGSGGPVRGIYIVKISILVMPPKS